MLNTITKESKTISGFDSTKAKTDITAFKKSIKEMKPISFDLETFLRFINGDNSEKFELGNFYFNTKNGQILDTTLTTAHVQELDDNFPRTILVNNQHFPSELPVTSNSEICRKDVLSNAK